MSSVASDLAVPATAPHYLSTRENWEAAAGAAGKSLEDVVATVIREYLDRVEPGEYTVTNHPNDLRQIYFEYDYSLNPDSYAETAEEGEVWYHSGQKMFVQNKGKRVTFAACGGCIPDVKIQSRTTGRSYFIECKAQNDAGNAHERCAKYATPSIIELVKKHAAGKGETTVPYHPIGYLFSGSLLDKRKYVVELQATFGFARDHLFLWKKEREAAALTAWIGRVVMKALRAGLA
jgi:hypothetical protein